MAMTPAAKEVMLLLEKILYESKLPKTEKNKWKKALKFSFTENEARFYLKGLRKQIEIFESA